MLKLLFIISIIAIPFNDFYPLLPLGEMKYELSAYFFLATMGLLVIARLYAPQKNRQTATQPLPQITALFFAVILISMIMNFRALSGGEYHGRTPMEKFLTSTATLAYGFAVAATSYELARRYNWHGLVIFPVAVSVGICSVVAVFEILSWTGGAFEKLYVYIYMATHLDASSGSAAPLADFFLPNRARSICFEPPSLANFAGFAWPWTYAGTFTAPRKHKYIYMLMWLMCTVLILVANSRTSLVLLLGNIVTLLLVRYIYLPPRPQSHQIRRATSFLLIMATLVAVLVFFIGANKLTDTIIRGTSVSNISRWATITAGFRMFLQSPIWGHGFGQFGFHILDTMPSWGYLSWEIRQWLTGPRAFEFWPSSFSIYARFAAELGILGIAAWIGIWVYLARTVWRVTFAYQLKTGKLLKISYPIIMSCYCALMSGIPLDSLRTPMMWVSMGLASAYIYNVRGRLIKLSSL